MNDFVISKAQDSDSKLLSVLFRTVYINTYGTKGITNEFANFIENQFSPDKILEDLANSNCDIWVTKYKNNPVGILQIEYKNPCPIDKIIYPELNKLYVLQRFFRQGIGQKLIQTAESEIIKKGNKQVWLWVLESNQRAIDFYNRQGFHNIGTANFQMKANNYKNIVMQKNL